MKYLLLFFTLLLLIFPSMSIAQTALSQDSAATVISADTSNDTAPPGDDYSIYTRKTSKDNLWKFSVGLSLFLMVIVLMLIMRRKKK